MLECTLESIRTTFDFALNLAVVLDLLIPLNKYYIWTLVGKMKKKKKVIIEGDTHHLNKMIPLVLCEESSNPLFFMVACKRVVIITLVPCAR